MASKRPPLIGLTQALKAHLLTFCHASTLTLILSRSSRFSTRLPPPGFFQLAKPPRPPLGFTLHHLPPKLRDLQFCLSPAITFSIEPQYPCVCPPRPSNAFSPSSTTRTHPTQGCCRCHYPSPTPRARLFFFFFEKIFGVTEINISRGKHFLQW